LQKTRSATIVLGLDVAVDDAERVGRLEREREVPQCVRSLEHAQCPVILRAFGECYPVDTGHDEEDDAITLIDLVDRHDVGMRQLRGRARLTQKTIADLGRLRERRWKHLDGDGPIELGVDRSIDDAHAAASDLADDSEVRRERAADAGPPTPSTTSAWAALKASSGKIWRAAYIT